MQLSSNGELSPIVGKKTIVKTKPLAFNSQEKHNTHYELM